MPVCPVICLFLRCNAHRVINRPSAGYMPSETHINALKRDVNHISGPMYTARATI